LREAARHEAAGLAPAMGLEGVPRQPCVRSAIGLAEAPAGQRTGLQVVSLACLAPSLQRTVRDSPRRRRWKTTRQA